MACEGGTVNLSVFGSIVTTVVESNEENIVVEDETGVSPCRHQNAQSKIFLIIITAKAATSPVIALSTHAGTPSDCVRRAAVGNGGGAREAEMIGAVLVGWIASGVDEVGGGDEAAEALVGEGSGAGVEKTCMPLSFATSLLSAAAI